MKKFVIAILTSAAVACAADSPPLYSLANPMQGTDSQHDFSHGNQYPAIALPFPMNVWAPYTQPQSDSFYYQYSQDKIRGIRQTHQPSPWIGDYANFSFMPISGKLVVNEDARASVFSHDREMAQPSYYKVHLDTWNTTAEVTPTLRGARFRFTYDKAADSYLILDVFKSKNFSSVEIIPSENKVIGIARNSRGGTPDNFGNYFVIQFDQPFADYGVWSDKKIQRGVTKLEGSHVGVFLKFDTRKKWSLLKFREVKHNVVTCKVASSFISPEQAELNLKTEIGKADFDTIRHHAQDTWNDYLGRVQIEGGMHDQRRTFYTSLYHSILWPHRFFEMDTNNQPVYFSPFDGKVHQGYLYTDTGYWDSFRSAHPLYNILYPEISAQIMQSIINIYNQGGYLPEWISPGYRVCMIGNHAFSLLTDAWMKGIRDFDARTAVAAMVHDANNTGNGINGTGRDGESYYDTIGYVPYSKDTNEPSVAEASSKTIEYSYDDFCVALLAQSIGDTSDATTFAKHAMNYKNVFDPKTGFMRGKRANGEWDEPFYPNEWGGPFTEGSSWQWTFNAMQDEPGFADLMGGWQAYADKLDALFAASPIGLPGTYGKPIHEMTEMTALNFGQYAANNEPVNHLIYMYDWAGQPWKAQVRLRQAMDMLYDATPDGISGDDDTGQMSAWYVFSALGFYPVCPGDPIYFIGSPLFPKVILHLQNGKTFTITAQHNMPQEYYIEKASLNGEPFDKIYLTHDQIMNGGELKLEMGSAPNYNWGVSDDSRPPSPISLLKE